MSAEHDSNQMLSFSITFFILLGFMPLWKALATMATVGTHPVMFSPTPPFTLLFSSHQSLSTLFTSIWYFVLISFFFVWPSVFDSLCFSYASYAVQMKRICFNFFTCVVCHMPAHVPRLPVTLSAQLPVACHQSCHSLPPTELSHWPQALTPHFMDHGPPAYFMHFSVRGCVFAWMMRNKDSEV